MVNVSGVPIQPFTVGITVTDAVDVAEALVVAVNEGIFPEPVADNPIEGLLLLQLYTVPLTAPVKFIAVVIDPLHNC